MESQGLHPGLVYEALSGHGDFERGGSETRDVCDGLDLTHASGSPLSVKSIQDER